MKRRRLKFLNIVDEYSRMALAIRVHPTRVTMGKPHSWNRLIADSEMNS